LFSDKIDIALKVLTNLLVGAAVLCVPDHNSLFPLFVAYWMLSYDS